ncbi:MAG: glycosyltransferase [Chloroflexota bacterium]
MRWRSILSGSERLSKLPFIVVCIPAFFLLVVTLRRWLFTIVALLSPQQRESSPPPSLPTVLLLVPFRNEALALPDLLDALLRLDFSPAHLLVVLVDDGSGDDSAAVCARVVEEQSNWRLLQLPRNMGKAAALNAALDRYSHGEFVAVYDADERPSPDALRRLVAAAQPPQVAAVSGRRALSNPLASPTASYVALENLAHQLITQQAKDRLHLAPAILGSNCLYRRRALEQVGRFRAGALLEDSDLTLRLARAGWELRFVPDAVSYHAAPHTFAGYWRQHQRWAGGFQDVAQRQMLSALRNSRLSWRLRLELALFSLGYADRLALAAVAFVVLAGEFAGKRLPALRRLLALALVTPFVQVAAALFRVRAPWALWLRLSLLPIYFLLDVGMAFTGIARTVLGRAPAWRPRISGA